MTDAVTLNSNFRSLKIAKALKCTISADEM
jgi:hypothetical protein